MIDIIIVIVIKIIFIITIAAATIATLLKQIVVTIGQTGRIVFFPAKPTSISWAATSILDRMALLWLLFILFLSDIGRFVAFSKIVFHDVGILLHDGKQYETFGRTNSSFQRQELDFP